jgi:glycogen debranching enzyme
LKYGETFTVFNGHGDIQRHGMGEQGIFHDGIRHLSEMVLRLWNEPPLLLSSTVEPNNFRFVADLANLDVSRGSSVAIHRGTLHLRRSKFLWRAACYEEFYFVNHGMESLRVPVTMSFDADFCDIFEVRGTHREHRGKALPVETGPDCMVLAYEGLDGVIRRTHIRCNPAPHSINGSEIKFYFELKPRHTFEFHVCASLDRSGKSNVLAYSDAAQHAGQELRESARAFPQISSSNSRFNDWVKRSIADVQMMTVGNPEKNYPYAGVPWFSTVFGRDGIITALEMLWVDPSLARGVLQFLAATQATDTDTQTEAEPGKILHELRHGEMADLREIPFGRYYGTVDATPLFVMLAGAYYERTGDRELIEELWPHIQVALRWMDEYGDRDGDGFIEYAAHGNRGLVQQGWKDSNDSIFHADGSVAEPPIALCEVQGYVYAAKMAAAKLSTMLGDSAFGKKLERAGAKLRDKFERNFWCEELGVYALALDGKKRPCRVRASNAGHCLYTRIAGPENAKIMAQNLFSKNFYSGWGIRTIAEGEARYNPLSYHNGSVWPHDNAIIANGLARYGFKELAGKILLALMDVSSEMELHRLPELYCGLERRPEQGPTLYPVACSPQAWAAASPFLVIEACLGVSVQAAAGRVAFERPCLPEGIPHLAIRGLRVGDSSVDLLFERQGNRARVQVLEKEGDLDVVANL